MAIGIIISVMVTDREMALINACKHIFPSQWVQGGREGLRGNDSYISSPLTGQLKNVLVLYVP